MSNTNKSLVDKNGEEILLLFHISTNFFSIIVKYIYIIDCTPLSVSIRIPLVDLIVEWVNVWPNYKLESHDHHHILGRIHISHNFFKMICLLIMCDLGSYDKRKIVGRRYINILGYIYIRSRQHKACWMALAHLGVTWCPFSNLNSYSKNFTRQGGTKRAL